MDCRYAALVAMVLNIACTGCAAIVDASAVKEVKSVVGQEYLLKKKSFLFETYCIDTGDKGFENDMCPHIQAQDYCDQSVFQNFKSNPDAANKRLRECLDYRVGWLSPYPKRIYGRIHLVGLLPKGIKIKIFKVYNYQLGTMGRCWIVKAKVVDGEFAGKVIELPSCIGKEPKWVEPIWVHQTKSLRVKEEFLSKLQ